MTAQATRHRPAPPPQHARPAHLLRAEWTKFRSVRGWIVGLAIGAILSVFLGVFAAGNANIGCGGAPGTGQPTLTGKACLPYVPLGPGGEAVDDSFFFVHRPLAGSGSITVRVTSLTGRHSGGNGPGPAGQPHGQPSDPGAGMAPGIVGWAKAGIMIKASTRQGSAYAAMMVTGSHGVRMQYDFTHDAPGIAGSVTAASPRWLRLTRAGDTITGYDSADGRHWSLVGTAVLAGLPPTVQSGMFATSPVFLKISPFFGGASIQGGPSVATGTFGHLQLEGSWTPGRWSGTAIGGAIKGDYPDAGGSWSQGAGQLVVTGSGNIAPVVPGPGGGFPSATIEQSLSGMFAGLIAIVVVAALFVTTEYRRGLMRLTLAATPRRGRVLAAKAIVAGTVSFAVGLVTAIACIELGVPRERSDGLYILPVSALTQARVVLGTAAMLAIAAMLAVAAGAIIRRSAVAVTTVIVAVILPFLLSVAVLPDGAASWVMSLSPAAGFAIEQSIPHYSQVSEAYSPAAGRYPLPPWAGLGVLCLYAAATLALGLLLLRRRDA